MNKQVRQSNRNHQKTKYSRAEENEGFNSFISRLDHAEKRINTLKERISELIQSEEQKEKRLSKSEESQPDLQDTMKTFIWW